MRMPKAEWLRSFVAVSEARSFTLAAQRLGLGQSTVSQHIRRLEETLGRTILARDTHSVSPTPEGDALLAFARPVLEAHERLERHFAGTELRGRLRLGLSEDFVLSGLQEVLPEFARRHPSVDLALTVGLSGLLYERFDAGDLDVIFAKRRGTDPRGRLAWREGLAWVGRPGIRPDPHLPLPLLLYPPPSITRALALSALEAAGRSWRLACTSGSLSGLRAAALAGLGVAPHSARLIPPGLAVLPASRSLPELSEIEFVVIGPGPHHRVATALEEVILQTAARLGDAA
ncbi:LysR substrate-binding domain-containing protein [Roseomonas sp. OT10]|uniref:LysR family transcriptional regulator n=1 Tax=Roseomonas cutis TaxID=2897332 RepID=UPI001E40AA5F|nr:LysR substrate-binding domain-containing protein [Roseomonas sp. OT10]UFN47341.1 LysR substrate-binding domain-containing protein [Roseomonas sp. OT10]